LNLLIINHLPIKYNAKLTLPTGGWAISPRFDNANNFSDNGLAAARENGKWGYINAQGEWVIQPRFYRAGLFAGNGLATAKEKENEKWGYINAQGALVIPPRFEVAHDFGTAGLAEIKENGKDDYINAQGKVVAYQDRVCRVPVLKNASGKTILKDVETSDCDKQKERYLEAIILILMALFGDSPFDWGGGGC
jgi:hypothetical protein